MFQQHHLLHRSMLFLLSASSLSCQGLVEVPSNAGPRTGPPGSVIFSAIFRALPPLWWRMTVRKMSDSPENRYNVPSSDWLMRLTRSSGVADGGGTEEDNNSLEENSTYDGYNSYRTIYHCFYKYLLDYPSGRGRGTDRYYYILARRTTG